MSVFCERFKRFYSLIIELNRKLSFLPPYNCGKKYFIYVDVYIYIYNIFFDIQPEEAIENSEI